jgi:hypothetical protein
VVRSRQPTNVRVVRAAGDTVWIDSAVVEGDSLVGTRAGPGRERVVIALADIRLLETREIEIGRTLGGIAAIGVAVSLVWFAMAASALSGGY